MNYLGLFFSIFFLTTSILQADTQSWNMELQGYLNIDKNEINYGGLSGLEISEDGSKILMITDKSFFFKANVLRDEEQNIKDLLITNRGRLLSSQGKFLDRRNTDSESIVRDRRGFYYISFESNNRVMMHRTIESSGEFLEKHEDFKKFGSNKGIEALAIDKKNRLVAIPEKPPKGSILLPIYRYEKGIWSVIKRIEINDQFLVTGAEFIANDKLLTLERKFSWTNGFKSRFRLLSLNFFDTTPAKVVFSSSANQFDNLEGIAIWIDKNQKIRVITVSDNNFHPFQRSEIREFILKFD